MSECKCGNTWAWSRVVVSCGVAVVAVGKFGFWKGVLYGILWEFVVGVRLAEWFWGK